MFCEKCGANLPPESTFCSACGEPVAGGLIGAEPSIGSADARTMPAVTQSGAAESRG